MAPSALSIQFPAYQIDFSAVAAGKRVAATKRRIRWRFGFPNLKALEEGRTGTDCRGEEHEVIIVWSITSGKRQIIMDGREIHFSSNRTGLIDFSWNAKGNHVFKTICQATPPLTPTPGYRQYDLFLDGQSFFRMPKVFELGVKGISALDNRMPGQYNNNSYDEVSPRSAYGGGGGGGGAGYASEPVAYRGPRDPSEEDAELQRAIQASLEDAKNHLGEGPKSSSTTTGAPDVLTSPPAPVPTADLLDFDGPPSSAFSVPGITENPSLNSYDGGLMSVYSAPPAPQQASYLALPPTTTTQPYGAPAPSPYQQTTPYGTQPPPQQQQYGAPPPPQQQSYLALPPSSNQAPPAQYPYSGQQQPQQYAAAPPSNGSGVDDPFAPKPPSIHDISNDILKQYGGPPPAAAAPMYPAIGYGQPPPPPPQQQQPPPPAGYYPPPGQYPPNPYQQQPSSLPIANGMSAPTVGAPSLSMNNTYNFNDPAPVAAVEDAKPVNPFDAVMKKLVNIDHIDEPAEEQMKLTMKQKEDERQKKLQKKSTPLPPAASRVVGSGATLRDIATVKPPTKKEIVMKPPPNLFQGDAAMAGALVEYGAPPPPLQPRGFGVVHMQGQYPNQPPPPQQGYGYR